jgi:hypothetical protein
MHAQARMRVYACFLLKSQWNTKVDVGDAIGVTRHHKDLLEYVAQETHTSAFADLGAVEQMVV